MLTSLRQTTREFPRIYSLKKAFVALLLIVLAVSSVAAYSILPAQAKTVTSNSKFNQPGNILITDQFNNRVIEIAPDGSIVWQFGNGPGDTSAKAIVGTNDAERVGSLTLMSGTGIPPGATTNCKSGCVDNRVLLVDQSGNIIWQYGTFGATGFGFNQLNTPVQNTFLPGGNILITDSNNARIVEVNSHDKVVSQYFTNTRPGSNPTPLPTRAVRLANGNTLISDQFNDQVIEINPSNVIVASYGTINSPGYTPNTAASLLNAPYSANVIGDYTGITPPF